MAKSRGFSPLPWQMVATEPAVGATGGLAEALLEFQDMADLNA
jgi:hypothetical protein